MKPEESKGGRNWSNYTWHGDQAPGVPFVTGLQNPDCDFNDMRNAKLHVGVGKNLVENKMADAHFFIEMMERGGKIVTITPEYSPPATKADYWIPCRPGLGDTAIFLGGHEAHHGPQPVRRAVREAAHGLPAAHADGHAQAARPARRHRRLPAGARPETARATRSRASRKSSTTKLQDYVVYDAAQPSRSRR